MALSDHERFTLRNPNRVLSMLGPTSPTKLIKFHRAASSGCVMLTD